MLPKMQVFIIWVLAVSRSLANEIILANNLFTPKLYKEVLRKDPNFLVSPFSTETLMAITQAGCKDETAREIRRALSLPICNSLIELRATALFPKLHDPHYDLHNINKIYVALGFPIRKDFNHTAVTIYHANLENIDFKKKDTAVATINSWVKRHTNDKISTVIAPKDIFDNTRVVLINAFYFKANWLTKFPKVKVADFYKTPKDIIRINMMCIDPRNSKDFPNYYEDDILKAKFLRLQLKGEGAFMTIVLPNELDGLGAIEKQVNQVFAPKVFVEEMVNIGVPKFKIETRTEMKTILKDLGVKKVFDTKEADLSGIAGRKGDLIIDEIVQETYIDVNEEGIEVAQSSLASSVYTKSLPFTEPKNFIADHPFIFYITVKDVVIFVGRVTEPKKSL